MIVTVQLLILAVATLVSLDTTLNAHHPFVVAVNVVVVGHDAVTVVLLTVTVCDALFTVNVQLVFVIL